MPEFSTPFGVKKSENKFTKEELVRAIRFSIAAEFEAIQLYEEIEESIDNKDAIALLHEISEDEKVHVGNFLKLLEMLAPEEKIYYEQGAKEAIEIIKDKK